MRRPAIGSALVALATLAIASLQAVAATGTPAASGASPTPRHAPGLAASAGMPNAPPPAAPTLVDINSASRAELKTLPGIGDAEADRIIRHRPYLTKTELVTKQVLPTGPYLSLRRQVVAMPANKPKARP